MRYVRRSKKRRRGDWKIFCIVASFVALLAGIPTVVIWRTSRPDVYWVNLRSDTGGAKFVAWRTLDDLSEPPNSPQNTRPDLFGTEVKVLGYMMPFPFPDVANRGQTVGRFLLVPDPENWLSPPHFHSGEVIDVRLSSGATVRLIEGKAFVVRGVMSIDPMKLDRGEAVFHMVAESIEAYTELRDGPESSGKTAAGVKE
jgi:hypothetical protein